MCPVGRFNVPRSDRFSHIFTKCREFKSIECDRIKLFPVIPQSLMYMEIKYYLIWKSSRADFLEIPVVCSMCPVSPIYAYIYPMC